MPDCSVFCLPLKQHMAGYPQCPQALCHCNYFKMIVLLGPETVAQVQVPCWCHIQLKGCRRGTQQGHQCPVKPHHSAENNLRDWPCCQVAQARCQFQGGLMPRPYASVAYGSTVRGGCGKAGSWLEHGRAGGTGLVIVGVVVSYGRYDGLADVIFQATSYSM